MKLIIISLLLLMPNIISAKEYTNKLIVYSTQSFSYIWQQFKDDFEKKFESNCNCKVEFRSFDGANTIISRLILEGRNSEADLIMGIDNNLKEKALDLKIIAPHNINISKLSLPITWNDPYFVPYDYGYLAFIYSNKKLTKPPKSFIELSNNPNVKIIIQDPRSSSLGMGLINWIKLLYQDRSIILWKKLKHNIVTVTKSWSDSYNLFSRGEADMLLSYSSSPIYNITQENNDDIKSAHFIEGHFLQVDLMAKLNSSKNQILADLFIEFILSQDFQKKIAATNYMYPVIEIELPTSYSKIFRPSKVISGETAKTTKDRNLLIQEWLSVLISK